MKILGQTMNDGSVRVIEAPSPLLAPRFVRVRTLFSAISPGTEGNKIVTGRMNLVGKARAKPDQVKQVIGMVSQLGLRNTIQKVRDKLEGAQPLGYSLSGVVIAVGDEVDHVSVGDLVACAGGGYANHADEVVVPRNLVVPIPAGVEAEAAAMATLAAIALQGVRLSEPTLGETAVVVGLGVIGRIACQLLKANGCRVYATDISARAVEQTLALGMADEGGQLGEDAVEAKIADFSRGRGADVALICAATPSSEPTAMAGRICRQRGRVVVVGAVGMDLPRPDYYEKELKFSVSCSYGPGRYDPKYEEGGHDYPVGFVRWTEGRNLEAALDLMAAGVFNPKALITHRFKFDEAPRAYGMIADRSEEYCGIILEYPSTTYSAAHRVELGRPAPQTGPIGIGFAGAGSFAQTFLLPPFKSDSRTRLEAIFTRTGLTAADVGKRLGFALAVDSPEAVLRHPGTDALVVATRHDQHGPLALAALRAGKHVFVEKPLCLNKETLGEIHALLKQMDADGTLPVLQVGFNRRFSEAARHVRKHFGTSPGPLTMMYRVSAGRIPLSHWTQDPSAGGGRIIGEVCHFIDLMQFVCDSDPVAVSAMCIRTANEEIRAEDNIVINLRFANGSVGCIGYFAEGAKSMPKEQLEVLGSQHSAVIENFQQVRLWSNRRSQRRRCSGKGHAEEVKAFIDAIGSGKPPISYESQLTTTLASFLVLDAIASGRTENIDLYQLAQPRAGDDA